MLEFSVSVPGVTEEGQGKWVLAVDPVGGRFLLVNEDKSFQWHPMADCAFAGLIPPDVPRPVMIVRPQGQPQQQGPGPAIVVPNRQARRHPLNGS